ncbi:vWA domain-containing protein [Candidatus Venteria ishoeyi]|uniref:von Willebrand factor type A domain protein n=1 Tax=Candidatus Venteria ishoeyi TaxID=1899563 RepID=A0A1H6FFF1_9GAMM|nr:VWA domain-containing protein [Candidatus Venteria ishoeyi]MDM8544977.1 VWA domain-containing protein [Candidatus Venteria ishoeyi]SEH07765.1 von Willebrand factor type A domain protein [Candidatus Venteria ishoeyi]
MLAPEPAGFHFAQAAWLYLLLLPLILWLLPPGKQSVRNEQERLRRYADTHLLPHVLIYPEAEARRKRQSLMLWAALWIFGVLAMAGPRWDFRDVNVFQPGSDLVVLMDLSRSMAVNDVRPSRLGRARQEVMDLLDNTQGVRVGIIAFATIAHVVAPITEDSHTLKYTLTSLSTDLVRLQGSRLTRALDRAEQLFAGQPDGNSRAVLLLSDGDFNEPDLAQRIQTLRAQGIHFYVLGIGTEKGSRVPAPKETSANWVLDPKGQAVVSKLNEAQLEKLADMGGGFYQRAHYKDNDTKALMQQIQSDAPPVLERNPLRLWNERYYLPLILLMLLLLMRFRRGSAVLRH